MFLFLNAQAVSGTGQKRANAASSRPGGVFVARFRASRVVGLNRTCGTICTRTRSLLISCNKRIRVYAIYECNIQSDFSSTLTPFACKTNSKFSFYVTVCLLRCSLVRAKQCPHKVFKSFSNGKSPRVLKRLPIWDKHTYLKKSPCKRSAWVGNSTVLPSTCPGPRFKYICRREIVHIQGDSFNVLIACSLSVGCKST